MNRKDEWKTTVERGVTAERGSRGATEGGRHAARNGSLFEIPRLTPDFKISKERFTHPVEIGLKWVQIRFKWGYMGLESV